MFVAAGLGPVNALLRLWRDDALCELLLPKSNVTVHGDSSRLARLLRAGVVGC